MSTDSDNNTPCPNATESHVFDSPPKRGETKDDFVENNRKQRSVSFPDEDQLVTQYFEPANPWENVPTTSRAQLAAEYLEACRRHATAPIDSVLQQIRELPECSIGGGVRAPRLALTECTLQGAAPADALEALLRKVQFRRLELEHAEMDDEGAEAIFDMIEYYESALVVSICGERQFGIRGWQAASRMIKKSAELTELEVSEGPLEASHAPVLARALRPLACKLRALCLQRASLSGEPLLCLVITLKSNSSVSELRLGDNRLNPADAAHIASLLRLNTRLQLLDLSNNQIQDAGAAHIFGALVEQASQSPPNSEPVGLQYTLTGYEARGLAFLVLWNNQLTRNCAVHIGKALRCSQSLCVLNIGRNSLGAECVSALCAGGALVSLGLQAARLGPDAGAAVARLLRAPTRLQRLDLRDNRLGVAGLQAILAALKENSLLTQIDLDEPAVSTSNLSVEDSDAPTIARLTAEVRAACNRNEPCSSPERRVHRRISLTCHTIAPRTTAEDERRGRLRSPAPSPAGSPVPAGHSRFSVTRVTPERESSSDSSSPSTPRAYCPAPSRFKVVQVSEPPQIQVHPASNPIRKSSSRFSVTRNYDAMYEPVTPPPSPAPRLTPSDHTEDTKNIEPNPIINKVEIQTEKPVSFNMLEEELSVSIKDKCYAKNECVQLCNDMDFKDDCLSHTEMVSVAKKDVGSEDNTENSPAKECADIFDFRIEVSKDETAMKQIEAITEDLGNLIQEFKDMTVKKVKNDCTQTDVIVSSKLDAFNVPDSVMRDNVVLKKNKSESSLDSPDLEVSRLMNKKLTGSPFCDSSSSLEISGSSVESLNLIDNQMKPVKIPEPAMELDRRKADHVLLSTESSIDSNTSEVTPVNSNLLNMSVSSNESVSPIIFGKSKKIHGSLSSLEASVSSLDSCRHDKVMVTSADSGIEYSLQNPSECKEDNSSNEGTLTNNSCLKETVKKSDCLQETITSPKRTASLLDVPALKTKGLGERMRKISWVAPSPSFHIPKQEEKEIKLNTHLEKLLSLFQHPLFSRNSNEEEKKSNTPPRKDSSLTSSFWSWGSATEKEREEKEGDSSSETTDSTLSERVQVSFVDESFSKKLDSKTPSTDTDNTLSEFQTFQNSEASEASQDEKRAKVTAATDDDCLVQKCLVLSDNACFNGNKDLPRTSDSPDLMKPNDLNKNYDLNAGDTYKNPDTDKEKCDENKPEAVRPRSFAAVLKSSGSENSLDKQNSPETGQPVNKLPTKVIRGIKENISPENTLTSSMTNTKTLALELSERQVKNQPIVNTIWDVTAPILEKNETKLDDVKAQSDLAPIATIEETCDESDTAVLDFIDDPKFDEKNTSADSGVTLESCSSDKKFDKIHSLTTEMEHVDLGKDALSYLIYENQDFEKNKSSLKPPQGSLAQELQDAEIKELLDLSPELIIDDAVEVPEVFTAKEIKGLKTSPVIPERAKIKKSNSLEELSQDNDSPKAKTIAFKVPEICSTTPRDIPDRRGRLRTRSGSSPKSLPESLNKPCPLSKMDSILSKKKKRVSSLGKMAKDSLLALNMSEDEIAEFRRSYKLTSVESLRSLESVSEDANSQNSMDFRCRACLRTSQESLMSLDSITEDCRCTDDCDKAGHSNR